MSQNTLTKEYVKGLTFKAEWNEQDFRRMKAAIRTHFGRKGANTKDGYKIFNGFAQLDECFGLAYTSSSVCAMYSICNTLVYLDFNKEYWYEWFAISASNDVCYAICQDKDGKELIIEL